jgi:hypothetical protein
MDIVLLWLLSNELHRLPWIITPEVGSVQRFREWATVPEMEPWELIIFWSLLKNYKWLDIERPRKSATLHSIIFSHSHTKMECLSVIHWYSFSMVSHPSGYWLLYGPQKSDSAEQPQHLKYCPNTKESQEMFERPSIIIHRAVGSIPWSRGKQGIIWCAFKII